MPVARVCVGSPREARVKGGEAGELRERTLDEGEHGASLSMAMGRRR